MRAKDSGTIPLHDPTVPATMPATRRHDPGAPPMASLIKFTNNYRDCSTDAGYQFEFNCDGCGTGAMSPNCQW